MSFHINKMNQTEDSKEYDGDLNINKSTQPYSWKVLKMILQFVPEFTAIAAINSFDAKSTFRYALFYRERI